MHDKKTVQVARGLGLAGAITLTGCIVSGLSGSYAICASVGDATRFSCLKGCTQQRFAIAQITPDATLGAERSVVIPNATVGDSTTDQISGGALRGTNLFHSFSEFNITNGQRVYFSNPVGIENIFSRVTGNNVSEILGTLGVDGRANLFLLNPNGIIFGPNARLDIRGSFFASTANSLVFDNGFEFSATNLQAPPLLTINVTPGLQYGTNPPRAIANAGNLSVGQNLTLAAGLLDLQGQLQAGGDLSLLATDTVQMRDTTANAFIAKAGGQLLVQGDRKLDISALNHPQSGLFSGAVMLLRSANPVQGDAHYTTGGSFRIEQLDGTVGDLSSPGDPIIRAGGDVSINTYQGASLHIFAGGQVNLGTVTITGADTGAAGVNFVAEDVTLLDGTQIAINGGTQPTLDVRAGMNPAEIDGTLGLSGVFGVLNPANPVTQTRTSADINIGTITMNAPNGLVFLTNQYKPDSSLPGGTVTLGTIRTDNTSGGFVGNSGSVVIDTRGGITIGDRIDASSSSGNAGDITLIAQNAIALDNSFLISDNLGVGQGGDITIQTGSLFASNGAQIRARTTGQGNAGRVTISAADRVSFDGISPQGNEEYQRSGVVNTIEKEAEGDSGGIFITTGSLSLLNGAQLQSRVKGKGTSGGISITARDTVSIAGVGLAQQANASGRNTNTSSVITSIEKGGEGQAGNITIQASSVALTRGGTIQSNTMGLGNAGNVRISATGAVLVDGSFLGRETQILTRVNPGGRGNGGNLDIEAASVVVSNGSRLEASNESPQNLDNAKAGNIYIRAGSVAVTTNAEMRTRTLGRGDAGRIEIEASDTVSFEQGGRARSSVEENGKGNAGNISIQTGSLRIVGDSSLISSTQGEGNAGDILIDAGNSVFLDGAGAKDETRAIDSHVVTGAIGNGGNIIIRTGTLTMVNHARVDARTEGQGNAAGNIDIEARSLSVTDSAQLLTRTSGSQRAGSITLNIDDSITLAGQGTGLFADTAPGSSGSGGDVTLTTGELLVRDGARIALDAQGTGDAGNLDITARSIELNNQAKLTAETDSGNGGNIRLQVQDLLLLRRNSQISTSAGNAQAGGGGDGGNITIDADFIVAVPEEDSDIDADAFDGKGGNINLTAQGIFGIEFREDRTPLSDITASSELGVNGTVQINTPDVDPSRGLTNLPTDVTDASNQIAQDCQSRGGKARGSFIYTGHGGLPTHPYEPLGSSEILADVEPPSQWVENSATPSTETTTNRLVEANGWIINENGEVVLVAQSPPVSSQWSCRVR